MVSPFLIFGVGVQIVLVGFLIWVIHRIYKFLKKSKKWGKDYDATLWARAVVDPEGAVRLRPEDVGQYRFNRTPKYAVKTRRRKWLKRIAVVNLAILLAVFSIFMVQALPGVLFPNIPTRTGTTVYYTTVNLNLTHYSEYAGYIFRLANTSEYGGTYPGGQVYIDMGVKRLDSVTATREVVLNLTSGTFGDGGTAIQNYVLNVTYLVLNQDTGEVEWFNATNEGGHYRLSVQIKAQSELRVAVLVDLTSFSTSEYDEYFRFSDDNNSGPIDPKVYVFGGHYSDGRHWE